MCLYEVFGVPRGVIFGTFVARNRLLREKVGPWILHTVIAFWLEFQGLQLPGDSKKKSKKQLVRMTMFCSARILHFYQNCLKMPSL